MNHKTDNEQLLNDVLAETAPPDFRGAMLEQTLGLVRRRRRWRQTRRVAGIVAVLGWLGILVWQKHPPHRASAPVTVAKVVEGSCTLVRTQPLSAGALVTTQPLAPERFITSVATVEIVQSGKSDYRVIDDDQLLALFIFHPAALIHVGPHAVQLVFVNPADEKGFPVN